MYCHIRVCPHNDSTQLLLQNDIEVDISKEITLLYNKFYIKQ